MIQDVNASTAICMGRIRDLAMYSKMVPHVKKVDIYDNVKFTNVSISCDVFLLHNFHPFRYFIAVTRK